MTTRFKLGLGIGLGITIGIGSIAAVLMLSSSTPPSAPLIQQTEPVWYSPALIPSTLDFCGEAVPLQEWEVKERIERELNSNAYFHSSTLNYIQRSATYFPVIEQILKEEGVPQDFKYLMVAESAMRNATSGAGAVGFWQFLKATAQGYGLKVDNQIDERYHFQKSTRAACTYLKESYAKFGSWTLAAASYNCGSGGAMKFSNEQLSRNYWTLLLPEETMRYLPRIIAIKTILQNPTAYRFKVEKTQLNPVYSARFETIEVTNINWVEYAQQNGISYKTFKYYNPWLRSTSFTSKTPVYLELALPN